MVWLSKAIYSHIDSLYFEFRNINSLSVQQPSHTILELLGISLSFPLSTIKQLSRIRQNYQMGHINTLVATINNMYVCTFVLTRPLSERHRRHERQSRSWLKETKKTTLHKIVQILKTLTLWKHTLINDRRSYKPYVNHIFRWALEACVNTNVIKYLNIKFHQINIRLSVPKGY